MERPISQSVTDIGEDDEKLQKKAEEMVREYSRYFSRMADLLLTLKDRTIPFSRSSLDSGLYWYGDWRGGGCNTRED